MISLTSELTDRKSRHAWGWLFYDAECKFCTRLARWLARPMQRRGLAVAPLQDPRVGALLALSPDELLRAIRFVMSDGRLFSGADALLAVARELWWARPLVWFAKIPGALSVLHIAYPWAARQLHCRDQVCRLESPQYSHRSG